MSKIKNIIFDFGGVFIDIDYKATSEAFKHLGIKNFDNFYKQDYASNLFEDLETGKIDEQNFYDQFNLLTQSKLTNSQIKNAWNAMIGDFWIERLDFVKSLKDSYKIFLLSNTNKIHFNCFSEKFVNDYPSKNFSNYFHQIYYSHIMGLRKPHKECYLKVLKDHDLLANETLFVDDTKKNIEGAQEVSLQVLHLLPEMNFKETISLVVNFPNK